MNRAEAYAVIIDDLETKKAEIDVAIMWMKRIAAEAYADDVAALMRSGQAIVDAGDAALHRAMSEPLDTIPARQAVTQARPPQADRPESAMDRRRRARETALVNALKQRRQWRVGELFKHLKVSGPLGRELLMRAQALKLVTVTGSTSQRVATASRTVLD